MRWKRARRSDNVVDARSGGRRAGGKLTLSGIAIVVVMFAPRGLAGIWHDVTARLFARGSHGDDTQAEQSPAAIRKA